MEKVISSINLYKHHNYNYYCTATIKDEEIISLTTEYGREGGELWSPKHTSNGNLQECLITLYKDFGEKFYKEVYKVANKEKLLSTESVEQIIRKKKLERISDTILFHKDKIKEAETKLDKLLTKI